MNNIELKKHIQEEIEQIDDTYILEGISRFIELNSEDEVYIIPSELKKKLALSDKQIDEGNYIDHGDLKQKIDKCYVA